jgi:hypothetical protein
VVEPSHALPTHHERVPLNPAPARTAGAVVVVDVVVLVVVLAGRVVEVVVAGRVVVVVAGVVVPPPLGALVDGGALVWVAGSPSMLAEVCS